LTLATEYRHLNYFGHILERLLSRVLEYEEDSQDKLQTNLLKNTSNLICQFPQMLDVILGSTRKTEVKYWKRLFDIIGSPQELFEKCIHLGQLKTAAGYLLVLHTLENFKHSSQNTARLLDLAYADGDIELCKELIRFLTAIDPSGQTLRSTLKSVSVPIDV
jgi:RAB6A-GEF complex partner protein 1